MNTIKIKEIWTKHGVYEKLYARYKKQIEDNFYPHMLDLEEAEDECGKYLCDFLGSVMSVFPSGKFYMPWTTNQTVRDVWHDRAFAEALENVLEDYGMWLQSGEGDPTDLFICAHI